MLLPSVFRFAHEVYVLTPNQVSTDKHDHSINILAPLHQAHNIELLILFTVVALAALAGLIWLKKTKAVQKLGKLIDRGTLWAPDLIRVVFGASLISSALHNALFGPELPLSFFPAPGALRWALFIIGTALIAGIFTRFFSLLSIVIYVGAFFDKGLYMLTYANYLGEALALVLVAYQSFSLDRLFHKLRSTKAKFTRPELALPATRILFGFALFYAAINVKLLHPAVSLDVVNRYHLTKYFPFDPMMVVLGAFLVEVLIAALYMTGLLQRVNTLIFVSFITLSLLYFKEAVWPHYLLFALAIGIFFDKPDKYTADAYLAKKFKN